MKFFYADEPDKPFRFFKMPKSLFEDERYSDISFGAKLLYGLMLDRVSLSKKSEGWIASDGRVYIHFSIQEVMTLLHVANEKATKLYKELEKAGLIQREKNGYGQKSRIYVCEVPEQCHENRESNVTESVNHCHENRDYIVTKNRSHCHENRDTSLYETDFTDTDSIETDFNETFKNYPLTPLWGGTGESSPISPEKTATAVTNKGKSAKGKRENWKSETLSQEDEAALQYMSPRLCEVVRSWITCKAEANHALTPTSKRALIEQVKRNVRQYGADIVADTIEESMANGYAGIAWSRAAQMKKAKDEQDKQSPSYGFKIIGDSDNPQERELTPDERWGINPSWWSGYGNYQMAAEKGEDGLTPDERLENALDF